MNQIKKLDRPAAKALMSAMQAALGPVARKFGVVLEVDGCSFSASNASIKVKVSTKGRNGEVKTKEAESFKALAELYGLEPSDLGREFSFGGNCYKLIGLNTRSSKYPLLAKRGDGKVFRFPRDVNLSR